MFWPLSAARTCIGGSSAYSLNPAMTWHCTASTKGCIKVLQVPTRRPMLARSFSTSAGYRWPTAGTEVGGRRISRTRGAPANRDRSRHAGSAGSAPVPGRCRRSTRRPIAPDVAGGLEGRGHEVELLENIFAQRSQIAAALRAGDLRRHRRFRADSSPCSKILTAS